jgi:hypothetical protein
VNDRFTYEDKEWRLTQVAGCVEAWSGSLQLTMEPANFQRAIYEGAVRLGSKEQQEIFAAINGLPEDQREAVLGQLKELCK